MARYAEIGLSRIEFDLLELLMRNTGIVLSRSQIYERIWDYDFGPESKNLAVYISYLRRKVDDHADLALIQTVQGWAIRSGNRKDPPDELPPEGDSRVGGSLCACLGLSRSAHLPGDIGRTEGTT
ncbi:MAG: winged helix-turn-helix domain-containing protein [Microthrixaceae bacterium]